MTSLRSGKWLFVAGMAISLFNFQCGTNLVAGHFLPGLSWAFFQSTLDTEGAKLQIYSEILLTCNMQLEQSKFSQAWDLHSNVSTLGVSPSLVSR